MEAKTLETQPTPKTTKERIAAVRARLAALEKRILTFRAECGGCGRKIKARSEEALAALNARHERNCPQRSR